MWGTSSPLRRLSSFPSMMSWVMLALVFALNPSDRGLKLSCGKAWETPEAWSRSRRVPSKGHGKGAPAGGSVIQPP